MHEDNFYDGPGSTSSATVHRGGRPVSKEKESKGHGSQLKRKRDEEEEEDGQKSSKTSGSKKGPKKFKRAFGFFVKAKRADAEARIGDASVSSVSRPFDLLLQLNASRDRNHVTNHSSSRFFLIYFLAFSSTLT